MVRFIEEGLEAGEAIMVAVIREHEDWLRDALATQASTVTFVDMGELGRNPARIIPAWQQFLDTESGPGRPARGIGEPIWPGRRLAEVLECQLHEALLNVAVDPDLPFWLVCPYDVKSLEPSVIEEAHRSHPVVVEAGSYRGSSHYGGRALVDTMFATELMELVGQPQQFHVDADTLTQLLSFVQSRVIVAGLCRDQAKNLAAATQRLAASSLLRGADRAVIQIWDQPEALVCAVADDAKLVDLMSGHRAPTATDADDSLWFANQVCDLVQMRSTAAGTTVRVHAWK